MIHLGKVQWESPMASPVEIGLPPQLEKILEETLH